MVHPVQSVVESLYAAKRCPRLHVNALYQNVVCPDFIREQWQERLIIDLDSTYPLDLTFSEHGLSADLSFGGYVTRCSFPWSAIYVVADRATGRGIVLDQHMPESVRRSRQRPTAGTLPGTNDPNRVSTGKKPRVGSGPMIVEDLTIAGPSPTAPGSVKETRPYRAPRQLPKDEIAVKKRRAAFRVIDGGGL